MDERTPRRFWSSLPVLGALAAGAAAWAALAPFGALEQWATAGVATASGAAVGIAVALALRSRPAWPLLAALAIGLGLWRGAADLASPVEPWTAAPGQSVRLIATVDAPVETRGATSTVIARIDAVDSPPDLAPPRGRLHIVLPALPAVELGDVIEVEGRVHPTDPAQPQGRRLLAREVVATAAFPRVRPVGRADADSVPRLVQRLRGAIEATAGRILPEPHASLLVGLMIGSASGMPEQFRSALVASGLTHVVVASGYNVTLVAAALRWGIRLGPPVGPMAPLAGVLAFTLLTGGTAPSVRAALMAGVALLAGATGRGHDALIALALASSAMILHDPLLIVDLSFQLSALATLGLIALSPRIAAFTPRIPRLLGEPLAATIAAELATAPLLAVTFAQLSLLAPVTNVLVAPLIPIATIGGALGIALAALLPPLGGIIGAALFLPTAPIVAIAEAAAAVPGALITVGAIPAIALVGYALGLLVWAALPTPEGQHIIGALRAQAWTLLPAALLATVGTIVLTAGSSLAAAPPPLSVTVLDVGDGDAVLVRTPAGHVILIDGGPNPSAVLSALGRRLGPMERTLTLAVLTGADQPRLAGAVAAAERYAVGLAVTPPERSPSALAERYAAAVRGRSIAAEEPLVIDLRPGVQIEVMPTIPVEVSQGNPPLQRTLAVRVRYGEVRVLVAPSLTPDAARALLSGGASLMADALVVPRRGDARGLDEATLAAIDPAVAIISVGSRNRSNPAPALLSLLEGTPTLRTDRHGAIDLRTDGARLWIEAERDAGSVARPPS